jgi:hypothetical protein
LLDGARDTASAAENVLDARGTLLGMLKLDIAGECTRSTGKRSGSNGTAECGAWPKEAPAELGVIGNGAEEGNCTGPSC